MSPRREQHVWLFFLYCLSGSLSTCAADLCNWRGSGLLRDPQSRAVQQVRLRCTEGAVEWMYPSQALRVVLEPNLSSARHSIVCIKPFGGFGGASAYVERAGQLHLLVTEGGRPEQVYCFRADGPQKPAIFLQATLQTDIGRRTVGFRYELLNNGSTAPGFPATLVQAECRPCNDTELLLAVCSSDFVVRGSISDVSHNARRQMSLLEVSVARVFRQRSSVFQRQAGGQGPWRGRMFTLRRCRVKAGGGHFLFTGAEHFGEAWLGCAPRYTDFVSVYRAALRTGQNHCEFALD